ncbi:MAG: methyltransferase [Anaeromyxobacter sp.]|nr:methyltransferase [Anaeromyxobacter sp.]MBL0275235.1 methyltransferase [Anaeromyxobacter sp.]
MVDVYLPMMKAAAIISAGQLRLFEALAGGPLGVARLAEVTGSSELGIRHLADFLVAVGYLVEGPEGLSNSRRAARWFTGQGDVDYTAGLLWTAESWGLMGHLTAAVRQGAPEKTLWESMQERPHWGPIFSSYMMAFARHLGPDLLERVVLPGGARRLLDLGGSHGLHSVGFCRRYPQLESVIVDFPSALTQTEAMLAREGLSDRIRVQPGNLLEGSWGDGYDVVLYLSVAHNQTAEDNARVLRHIGAVLRPGGLLVIHEYLAGAPLDVYDAAFRLTLLVETATRTYSLEEISAWLADAGFEPPERTDLAPREKGSLVFARRRA